MPMYYIKSINMYIGRKWTPTKDEGRKGLFYIFDVIHLAFQAQGKKKDRYGRRRPMTTMSTNRHYHYIPCRVLRIPRFPTVGKSSLFS